MLGFTIEIWSREDGGRKIHGRLSSFFFYCYDHHQDLHSFPTRRSSDLISVKALQTLARHSDPKLTLNVYSHLSVFDTAAALDALPDLTRPDPVPEAVRKTGTDSAATPDRKSTRLNSSHEWISYAVFCLK